MEPRVQSKCVVTIDFWIKDASGVFLEASAGDKPLSYLHGGKTLWPAIEDALQGKRVHEEVFITLSPEKTFGFPNQELKKEVLFTGQEHSQNWKIGDVLCLDDGDNIEWRICRLANDRVYLDGNHPWAGKTLQVWAKVLGIRPASSLEVWNNNVYDELFSNCGPDCRC